MFRNRLPFGGETLETRTALDASNAFEIQFEPSELVKGRENGLLQFASLRVGERFDLATGGDPVLLEDTDIITVRDHEVSYGRVKAYLHGFADSIGTDLFIETLDLRFSSWGSGSGSTSRRFEDYVEAEIQKFEPCQGLAFSGAVRFDLPGEGGEFFTGGFLEIREDGRGGLLRGGDIAEVVEDYDLSVGLTGTQLTVDAMFGEMVFSVNADKSLTDEFGRIWEAESEYDVVDPDSVDSIIGDIDGNGAVEFADFLILSEDFGTEEARSDLDGDGFVGFSDFLLLSSNFGT